MTIKLRLYSVIKLTNCYNEKTEKSVFQKLGLFFHVHFLIKTLKTQNFFSLNIKNTQSNLQPNVVDAR